MSELSEWVFESVLQFLKSPLWTMPVNNFIDLNCHEFVAEEEENRLIYTQLHNEFCVMVDDLLTSFLTELGVSGESFVEAVKCRGAHPELCAMVSEYIYALDDFPTFRAMMEKKNVELELEAMYEYAKYSSAAAESFSDMSEEERFLFEMAIHMSLGDGDIAMKRIEREDAELLQALAMSMAIEMEKQMYNQLRMEAAEAQGQEAPLPSSPPRSVEQIHEEIRQRRVENVERAVRDIGAPAPAPVEAHKIIEPSLAPLGDRRQGAGSFAHKSVLGGIASNPLPPPSSGLAPLSAPAPREPTFNELKRQAEERANATSNNKEPSKEEMEQRATYFRMQREKLLQQKQKERGEQMSEYQRSQQLPVAPVAQATSQGGEVVDEAARAMRVALARRFKDDLVMEARKATNQAEQ